MKASAERSAATNHRTWVVANLLVLCLGLLGPNAALADNLVIEGSKLPWTAEFPGYWFGGTAESMERVLARTTSADWVDQRLKMLIREMLPEAKSLDAIFFHMDVTGMKTETVSSLRVNVITSIEQLPEESGRKAIWKSYGQRLTTEYPEESKVAEKGDRIAITAGRDAYEGTFLITLPDGVMMYEVVHVVAYDPGLMHIFSLRTESPKFRARYADLETILKSLKYLIRGKKLPWRAILPAGWIGGNELFIETARGGTKNEGYRELMTRMLREARTLDAFLLRFDYETDAISSLRVNVDELSFDIADATRRQESWVALSKSLANRHPKGSKVKVMPEHLARTGGRQAYETTFQVALANGSKVHYVSHIVPCDAKKAHIFLFETDSQAFKERYSELQEILTSLKYSD